MSKITISHKLGRVRYFKLPGGDAMAPNRFTATFEADGEGVSYVLDVELDADGHSRCLNFEAHSEQGIPSSIKLPRLLQWATGAAAGTAKYCGPLDGGGFEMQAATDEEADAAFEKQASRTPARRRDARSKMLADAAAAFNESGGSVQAIMDACHVTKSTAYRYRNEARSAGLLAESQPAA